MHLLEEVGIGSLTVSFTSIFGVPRASGEELRDTSEAWPRPALRGEKPGELECALWLTALWATRGRAFTVSCK